MPANDADHLLAARIRGGDADAWSECIARFEGRLLAFVESRLNDPAASEDVVQETFLGFLTALPNYDLQTPLETFLFSIAAHKLTDVLRKRGNRPALRPFAGNSDAGDDELPSRQRVASSLARSQERRTLEERLLRETLSGLIGQWRARGEFERLKCTELLFVLGWTNQAVAQRLAISEQAVANHKFLVLAKIKEAVQNSSAGEIDMEEFGIS